MTAAAATLMHPKGIPIFLVGNCGVPPETLNIYLAKRIPAQILPAASILDGFQSLILRGRGILIIEMRDQNHLRDFAKSFQVAIKNLKIANVRILIISAQKEILASKSLSQFTFIRVWSPITDLAKAAGVLIRDYRALEAKSLHKSARINIANSDILIIKGTPRTGPITEQPAQQPLPESAVEENPLLMCLGQDNPSFLYDKNCNWRVRGHFTEFDSASSSIVFRADDKTGTSKLNSTLTESSYLLSSTSSTQARVCMTLDYVGQKETDFIFKTPSHVQEIQRRNDPRTRTSEEYPILAIFFDPTQNSDMALTVLDISAGGVGVRIDKDLVKNYKIGQTITNFSIIFSQRVVVVPAAQVRHHSRSDTNPDFKILGLQFDQIDKKDKSFIEMYVLSKMTMKSDQ
jgi:hypothetical protein